MCPIAIDGRWQVYRTTTSGLKDMTPYGWKTEASAVRYCEAHGFSEVAKKIDLSELLNAYFFSCDSAPEIFGVEQGELIREEMVRYLSRCPAYLRASYPTDYDLGHAHRLSVWNIIGVSSSEIIETIREFDDE